MKKTGTGGAWARVKSRPAKCQQENMKERDNFGDLEVDDRIVLNAP
jgi:hypothetical protein